MQSAPAPENALSRLNEILAGFVQRLRSALGEDLISVVLFGGAARGVFDPASSDANVMLVLRQVSLPLLDQVAGAAEMVRSETALNLLTLTEDDLADSGEVFPTKFLDIRRHHQILWGRDVAGTLHIPRDRLERQARRELMNLHLRLRQTYLETRRRPEQLAAMIRRSATPLLLNLGVLLELASNQNCEGEEAVLIAAKAAGFDQEGLRKVIEFKQDRHLVDATGIAAFYEAFMRFVEAALKLAEKSNAAR